jgi:hypothetical protein
MMAAFTTTTTTQTPEEGEGPNQTPPPPPQEVWGMTEAEARAAAAKDKADLAARARWARATHGHKNWVCGRCGFGDNFAYRTMCHNQGCGGGRP